MADLSIPDEMQVYIRAELARSDQLRADADRKRQEFEHAPGLYRIEYWKTVIAALAAVAVLSGAVGVWLGSRTQTIIIQQLPAPPLTH